MQAQVLKWGNSLAVRIPKPIAEDANLQLGDPLEIAVAADGVVQLHRVGEIPTLSELVAQISPENRYAEISLGPEIGREGRRMVNQYVPGHWRHCLPGLRSQVGREQAKRRPALVLTDLRYNRAIGLAVVCP